MKKRLKSILIGSMILCVAFNGVGNAVMSGSQDTGVNGGINSQGETEIETNTKTKIIGTDNGIEILPNGSSKFIIPNWEKMVQDYDSISGEADTVSYNKINELKFDPNTGDCYAATNGGIVQFSLNADNSITILRHWYNEPWFNTKDPNYIPCNNITGMAIADNVHGRDGNSSNVVYFISPDSEANPGDARFKGDVIYMAYTNSFNVPTYFSDYNGGGYYGSFCDLPATPMHKIVARGNRLFVISYYESQIGSSITVIDLHIDSADCSYLYQDSRLSSKDSPFGQLSSDVKIKNFYIEKNSINMQSDSFSALVLLSNGTLFRFHFGPSDGWQIKQITFTITGGENSMSSLITNNIYAVALDSHGNFIFTTQSDGKIQFYLDQGGQNNLNPSQTALALGSVSGGVISYLGIFDNYSFFYQYKSGSTYKGCFDTYTKDSLSTEKQALIDQLEADNLGFVQQPTGVALTISNTDVMLAITSAHSQLELDHAKTLESNFATEQQSALKAYKTYLENLLNKANLGFVENRDGTSLNVSYNDVLNAINNAHNKSDLAKISDSAAHIGLLTQFSNEEQGVLHDWKQFLTAALNNDNLGFVENRDGTSLNVSYNDVLNAINNAKNYNDIDKIDDSSANTGLLAQFSNEEQGVLHDWKQFLTAELNKANLGFVENRDGTSLNVSYNDVLNAINNAHNKSDLAKIDGSYFQNSNQGNNSFGAQSGSGLIAQFHNEETSLLSQWQGALKAELNNDNLHHDNGAYNQINNDINNAQNDNNVNYDLSEINNFNKQELQADANAKAALGHDLLIAGVSCGVLLVLVCGSIGLVILVRAKNRKRNMNSLILGSERKRLSFAGQNVLPSGSSKQK